MKRIPKTQPPQERPGPIFTLNRDGGLVVSRKVLVKEGVMKRQIDAARRLHESHLGNAKPKKQTAG